MRAKILKQHIFFTPAEIRLPERVGSKWSGIPGNQAAEHRTICGFPPANQSGHGDRKNGGSSINTQILREHVTDPAWVWMLAMTTHFRCERKSSTPVL
jgi:hypothetical protein